MSIPLELWWMVPSALSTLGLSWAIYYDVKWGGSFDSIAEAFLVCFVGWVLILWGRLA
jgi:hypothetical protein